MSRPLRVGTEEIGALQARHLLDAGCAALAYAAPPSTNPRAVMARSRRLGICAFDDSVGAIALAAARVLDLAVPAALAVIGVDDAPFSPFLAPPLTTLAIDGRSTGLALAERFLNDDESRDRSHAAARLVRRASV